jgi:transcription factor TFIIIB component B''
VQPTGEDGQARPAPKRARKRKQRTEAENEGEGEGEGEGGGGEEDAKKKRRRAPTPDNAENQVIDPKTMKMSDLTKDLRIGKKSSRHDALKERERQERAKYPLPQLKVSESPAPAVEGESVVGTPAPVPVPAAVPGPTYRIEGGQIRLVDNSVVLDRHARDAVHPTEAVEEDEFTRRTTSNSYRKPSTKLSGPNRWTKDDEAMFWELLRRFGADFEVISHCFLGKTRTHIQRKFKLEDKKNPAKVTWALVGDGRKKLDAETEGLYQRLSGRTLINTGEFNAQYAARQKELDEQAAAMDTGVQVTGGQATGGQTTQEAQAE